MSPLSILFYIMAALVAVSTALAVTRRNMVHAVLYLVLSFFSTAMLFYLLGAPFLAALEVIIYAGAIMVLFLFLIMMIRVQKLPGMFFPLRQLWPALIIAGGFLIVSGAVIFGDSSGRQPLSAAQVSPGEFGLYLFREHWLSVEIASLLLLAALVGAYVLGRNIHRTAMKNLREDA
jgi:NADH-quinone oxidoreductase subunit J